MIRDQQTRGQTTQEALGCASLKNCVEMCSSRHQQRMKEEEYKPSVTELSDATLMDI